MLAVVVAKVAPSDAFACHESDISKPLCGATASIILLLIWFPDRSIQAHYTAVLCLTATETN